MKRIIRNMVARQVGRTMKAVMLVYAAWMVIEYLVIMHRRMMNERKGQ